MNNYLVKNKKKDNAYKLIVGGIFIVFGLFSLSFYIGYLFLSVAFVLFFYNSGVEFDTQNNKLRKYNSFFSFKHGNWKDLNQYYSISIKKTRKEYKTLSRSNTSSIDTLNTKYEVLLMGRKHSDTILLYDSINKNKSLEFAKICSGKINLPIKTYGYK